MSVSFNGAALQKTPQAAASKTASQAQFGCASHTKFGATQQAASQKTAQQPKFGIILGGAEVPLCAAICASCCCILPLVGAAIFGGKSMLKRLFSSNNG
jgi:hypothetical protein